MLAGLDGALRTSGVADFRFLIVGEGSERSWLRRTLPRAELPGILRGEDLAQAYASMDAFVFPSLTDTFGNVVLEALASGVPAIVASAGGPRFLVEDGRTGFIAATVGEFAAAVARLYHDPALQSAMAALARQAAGRYSWDQVLEEVHAGYDVCFPELSAQRKTSILLRTRASSASV
jgi:phosphatidylinositol alpha 1,6-mannosyltransferase